MKRSFFFMLTLACIDVCWCYLNASEVIHKVMYCDNLSQAAYYQLQDRLNNRQGQILDLLGDYKERSLGLRIIGKSAEEVPEYGEIVINTSLETRENCLILYASFNRSYPMGLRRLVEHVKKTDFRGTILYRIGGWPDVAGDGLSVIDVPYAFKVCIFREAQRKGFKKALFLDTSVIPLVSLNAIFDMIQEKGFFVMGNFHNVGPYASLPVLYYFGVSLEQANSIPSCSAGLLGVDFTQPLGAEIIDRWYKAARRKTPFFSPRPEQTALSLILYQLGITDFCDFFDTIVTDITTAQKNTLFLLDKSAVHCDSYNDGRW